MAVAAAIAVTIAATVAAGCNFSPSLRSCMINTHFTDRDIIFLVCGFALTTAGVVLFHRGKVVPAVLALVLGGFSFRLMMAFIDPFLHSWDEQYHALVAKNLANHFFTPTLVDQPLQTLDPSYWAYTNIWLHKPPMFLWQMALSIKMFGATPWAIRIPSVLLSTLMIPAVYRMGKILANERTGFVAALLLACSNILINIVSGFLNTDHNDVVFIAYVCFSFWAWTEYVHSPQKRWITLVGIFAGAAVLTKWLPGLMVFGAWGISILAIKENRVNVDKWKHIFAAFSISIIVAAPWFFYAALKWPESWNAAMGNYSEHLSNDFSHGGSWWFHFDALIKQNGIWFVIALMISLVPFFTSTTRKEFKIGIPVVIVAVYTFYTFVAARMPLFCVSVLPLFILLVALLLDRSIAYLRNFRWNNIAFTVICLVLVYVQVDIGRIEHHHTDRDPNEIYRKTRINNRACFERALKDIPSNAIVFNCSDWNAVACMYYVNCTAYDNLPDETQVARAKEQKRPVLIFDDGQLPEWIRSDTSTVILKEALIRNGF